MLACVVSGSGFFLRYWQSNQVMGSPGVILDEDSSMDKPPVRLPDWVLNYVGEDLKYRRSNWKPCPRIPPLPAGVTSTLTAFLLI